jgi:hypothetical protein
MINGKYKNKSNLTNDDQSGAKFIRSQYMTERLEKKGGDAVK